MKKKVEPKQILLNTLRSMEEKLTEEKTPKVKRKLALNHILIIIFSICAFGFTLFPMFDFGYNYIPDDLIGTSYWRYKGSYSPFLDLGISAWGLPLLICPVILPIVVCLPLSEQRRKLWTCTIAALNLGIFVLCFFLIQKACSNSWYTSYPEGHLVFSLGSSLLTGAHGACFLVAILPDRLFRKKQTAPAMRQNSLADRRPDTGICKTCGAALRQDGTCPDCYKRMVLLKQMQEMSKSSD